MPGRKYTASSFKYRYGFNGKENDNEMKGEGNQQDYGMRIYDTRLVRFLSEDPITDKYPELTPYQFAGNTPIQAIDLDGLEPWFAIKGAIQWLLSDEVNDINEGNDRMYNGLQKMADGPSRGVEYEQISRDPNSDYTIEQSIAIRKADGLTQAVGGAAQVALAYNSITAKLEVVKEGISVVNTLLKPSLKYVPKTILKRTTSKNLEDGIRRLEAAAEKLKKMEERATKLSKTPRPGKDFTKAGKEVVKDINKAKNNGQAVCEKCGVTTIPAKKSTTSVTPPKTETQVDHIKRKSDGGSGTPDNGQVLCRGCNLEKH